MAPPRKTGRITTGKATTTGRTTITGKTTITGRRKAVLAASVVSDEKAKVDCEKRGGVYIPATETQSAICIISPRRAGKTIVISKYRDGNCHDPIYSRDKFILVPPTRELAEALLRAIRPIRAIRPK